MEKQLCLILIVIITFSSSTFAMFNIDSTGGSCSSVGTFSVTICKLTTNVNDMVAITSDGITLDCDGNTITTYGYAIDLSSRDGVTIQNCIIRNADYGIYLYLSSNINLLSNDIQNSVSNAIQIESSNNV